MNKTEPKLSDVSVEAITEKAKDIAVARAADILTHRILDKIGKDAQVKKMRQESIAKAREKLEKNGRKSAAPVDQPSVSTEVVRLTSGQKKRLAEKKSDVPTTPPAEAQSPIHS